MIRGKIDKSRRNYAIFNPDMRIVAFGNPLLDTIVVPKDKLLLTKYNLTEDGQKEITPSEMESLSQDIKQLERSVRAGGCAQNTLKVVQWLLRKQCSTIIFGSVGNDEQGDVLREILERDGVQTNYIKKDHCPTGVTVALVNGPYRSLVASLGAAETITLDDFKSNPLITEQIDNADLVYMEGFFLSKRAEVAKFILDYCTGHGKVFVFNTSGQYMCKEQPELVLHFVKKSNIVIGNRAEFEAICAFVREPDVESFLRKLSEGGRIFVMTDGPRPVLCVEDGGRVFERVVVPSMKRTEIVDTTGAGDSFVAGFLVGYLLKRSLINGVELGCYAAQEIIKNKGCAVPTHPPGVLL